MKVAISGAGGFLGREAARSLRARGHEVVALARAPGPGQLQAELGRPLDAGALEGVDRFLHLAWDLRPGAGRRNTEGTAAWCEQARAAGVGEQVFVTSVSAWAGSPSEYGRAKFITERLFLERGDVVLRPGLVVGPGGLCARLRASARRWPVTPVPGGAGIAVRLVALADLVRLLAEPPAARAVAWNVFAPRPVTMSELMRRLGGRPILPIAAPLVRVALAALAVAGPGPRAARDRFRALDRSQDLALPSDWRELGIAALTLEAMLESPPWP